MRTHLSAKAFARGDRGGALNQASPLRALPDPVEADITVIRRERLGGLLHEYAQVA